MVRRAAAEWYVQLPVLDLVQVLHLLPSICILTYEANLLAILRTGSRGYGPERDATT